MKCSDLCRRNVYLRNIYFVFIIFKKIYLVIFVFEEKVEVWKPEWCGINHIQKGFYNMLKYLEK